MTNDIEPLAPALWFQRIEMIARGDLNSMENSLRHAAHLLHLTPRPFRHVIRLSLDEDAFEALLDAGDLDTAARHLVAQPAALTIEADSPPTVRALISCTILNQAVHGTGDSIAAAVVNAWTTCLLALRTRFGEDLLSLAGQGQQLDQSVRHRRPS